MEIINCIGDVCPIPVVKTKNAIDAAKSSQIKVLVDNSISFENVQRFVAQRGLEFSASADKDFFSVIVKVSDSGNTHASPVAARQVVVFSSNTMGHGNDELGHILVKSFIFALTQLDTLPNTLVFYNHGANLCLANSPVLPDLLLLEKSGVQLLVCGTCLNFLQTENELAVGKIANMYEIAEIMLSAANILRP